MRSGINGNGVRIYCVKLCGPLIAHARIRCLSFDNFPLTFSPPPPPLPSTHCCARQGETCARRIYRFLPRCRRRRLSVAKIQFVGALGGPLTFLALPSLPLNLPFASYSSGKHRVRIRIKRRRREMDLHWQAGGSSDTQPGPFYAVGPDLEAQQIHVERELS